MPLSQKDFERACNTYKNNWLGAGSDGNTVSQRFDKLQLALIEVIDALANRPPPISEARVKELIAAAILAQQPQPEVDPDPPVEGEPMLLQEDGEPLRLQETSNDPILLTEAAT